MRRDVKIFREHRVSLDTSVSDARFVDEDTLLLIDEEANLWQHSLILGSTTMVARRSEVVGDYVFPERLRARIFPRIAVGTRSHQVVVNTEDAVMASRDVDGRWRTMLETWGLYDPLFGFSPAGDGFVVLAGSVLLVWGALPFRFTQPPRRDADELHDSTIHESKPTMTLQNVEVFTWSTDGRHLVVLRDNGAVQFVDYHSGAILEEVGGVSFASEETRRLGTYALSFLDENSFVISLEAWSLDFWRLRPLELITRLPVEDVAHNVSVDLGGSWFATESERELRFWDSRSLSTIRFLAKPGRRWDALRFSPNRSRMLSIGEPAVPGAAESLLTRPKVTVTVWRVVFS